MKLRVASLDVYSLPPSTSQSFIVSVFPAMNLRTLKNQWKHWESTGNLAVSRPESSCLATPNARKPWRLGKAVLQKITPFSRMPFLVQTQNLHRPRSCYGVLVCFVFDSIVMEYIYVCFWFYSAFFLNVFWFYRVPKARFPKTPILSLEDGCSWCNSV